MRADGLPYGGAKAASLCDPGKMSKDELERLTDGTPRRMIPIYRAAGGRDGAGFGHKRTGDGWMMTRTRCTWGTRFPAFHGQTMPARGSLGVARRRTWGGLTWSTARPTRSHGYQQGTGAVQGFGNVGSVAALSARSLRVKIRRLPTPSGAFITRTTESLGTENTRLRTRRCGFPEGRR